jgi:hypothetical protein
MKKLPLAFALVLLAAPVHAQGLGVNLGLGGTHVNVGLGGGGVGVGIGVGGVANVGAGLGGGGLTTNVGVGSGGGVANVGVGLGGGGLSANAGVGGGLVGVNAGVGSGGVTAGVGVGGAGVSAGIGGSGVSVGTGATGGTGAVAGGGSTGQTSLVMVAPASSGTGSGAGASMLAPPGGGFALPASLKPNDHRRANGRQFVMAALHDVGVVPTTPFDVAIDRRPVRAVAGTPMETVATCRAAILNAAASYNPVYATTASAGSPRATGRGLVAPIQTKLIFMRQGGYEVRQSKVSCAISPEGLVAGLS